MSSYSAHSDAILPSLDSSEEYGSGGYLDTSNAGSFKFSWISAIIYLLVVRYGIDFMKKRKPLNIKQLVVLYDAAMVIFNAYIVKEVLEVAVKERFFFKCNSVDYYAHKDHNKLQRSLWLFHYSKLIECLDTVFFILSGKIRLVTWLHIYHHCTMIPFTCMMAKWIPSGHVFTLVMTNGSVHVIMYTYYALAALGPAWRKYLWWKRYLTIIQMIQFAYGSTIAVVSVYMGCAQIPLVYICSVIYILSLLACFYNHYYQTYRAKQALSPKHEKVGNPTTDQTSKLE